MNHWVTLTMLLLGPDSMFSIVSGCEVTSSWRQPRAEAHMTHALDPKFKGAHRQHVIQNVYASYRDSMIVQCLMLEVAQVFV